MHRLSLTGCMHTNHLVRKSNLLPLLIHHSRYRNASSLCKDRAYVNGQWVAARSRNTYKVTNPATGDLIGSVPDMNEADTQAAIDVAYRTFQTWKKTTAKERSEVLKRMYTLMIERKDELARLITFENGKPLAEAEVEIMYGASITEWFAEEARRVQGSVINSPSPTKRMLTLKQPIGVCGMITPWNFPNVMITRKACAAIAAGCTVVLKPAEDTPYSALAICQLAEEAGIPPGVLNVVTCDRGNAPAIGKILCESPLVSLISFTGSSAVGKVLLRQSADTVKKCTMELGGNSPFIVFDSANIDAAVAGLMASKFRCTGQTCVCANRIYVQEGVYEEFVTKLAAAMDSQLKIGDGMTPGTTQGPLINSRAVDKIERLVKDAVDKGAEVVRGGTRGPMGGTFYTPTLLKDVKGEMMCVKEEIFGPVASVLKFRTEAEVLKQANDVSAGLAGYVYTQDISQSWRVAEGLEYGIASVNEGLFQTAEAPFGGYKESGLGREGGIGYGIEEYVEVKYMCIGGI